MEIKSLSWKKIQLVESGSSISLCNSFSIEIFNKSVEMRLKPFKELFLQTTNNNKTVQGGEIKKILTEAGLGHAFNWIYNL